MGFAGDIGGGGEWFQKDDRHRAVRGKHQPSVFAQGLSGWANYYLGRPATAYAPPVLCPPEDGLGGPGPTPAAPRAQCTGCDSHPRSRAAPHRALAFTLAMSSDASSST
ncbi:uncharacterized protein TRAVEDRAFT_27457 [Trametes versicolor FP-101664 SS1]|uniref:uncharacterized protein n=1 Tax=Trametes versicolor (strain FP-101664) TaxID=717944 RepID=UPI0004623F08|nr:uncharacterized protein TRAVEDRAFT_27457 [Trametes versicolor FP-101664 SS1]EIW62069.1 hypothetical protein TRAVEDRAFT_27457 [Trametes versicolor FP-101664 SS1]